MTEEPITEDQMRLIHMALAEAGHPDLHLGYSYDDADDIEGYVSIWYGDGFGRVPTDAELDQVEKAFCLVIGPPSNGDPSWFSREPFYDMPSEDVI